MLFNVYSIYTYYFAHHNLGKDQPQDKKSLYPQLGTLQPCVALVHLGYLHNYQKHQAT
jgi:hypothetical protein